MLKVDDFIVAVYCLVSDFFQLVVGDQRLRRRGPAPALTDSEVLTMEIVGEFLGFEQDTRLWWYFRTHWRAWFPTLGDRTRFVRQAADLWRVKQVIRAALATALGAHADPHHLLDGIPLPICKPGRAARAKLFRGATAWSYCAAKDEFYFGFKGHLRVTATGLIVACTVTAANVDEREAAWDLLDPAAHGWWFGDKGYLSAWFKEQLSQLGIRLDTPVRCNMPDPCAPGERAVRSRVRRLIETVFGQLTERFHMARIRARDLLHLTSRIERKLLAHTIAYALNRSLGRDPLDFEGLVAA